MPDLALQSASHRRPPTLTGGWSTRTAFVVIVWSRQRGLVLKESPEPVVFVSFHGSAFFGVEHGLGERVFSDADRPLVGLPVDGGDASVAIAVAGDSARELCWGRG